MTKLSTKINKKFAAFIISVAVSFVFGLIGPTTALAAGPASVNLLSAGNFAILSETGITNTGSHACAITGNIGSSPITAAAMDNVFCSEIAGTIYGVNAGYTGSGTTTCFAGNPPLSNKTLVDNAVLDMETAYVDAAGRTLPNGTELYAGNLGGQTFAPGLYKWSTDVIIPTDVTLSGGANDVWIFQIAGNLSIASGGSVPAGIKVLLTGGAKASNVFWQVGGGTGATLGTHSTFNGNILSAKQIIIQTGAVLNGRALAQTQVTLDANTISIPTDNQTCSAINLVSGINTQTAGFTETVQASSSTALSPAQYNHNGFVPSFATQTVIPPWIDPSTDSNFTGSGAVWASTDPTWPGGSGNTEGSPGNNQWRLFQDSFNLPSGATVTSAQLSYTADNAADVYLNGNTTPISTTNDVYGAVPPALPQNFASVYNTSFVPVVGNNTVDFVVRNWGNFDDQQFNPNPTGLLYNAVVSYCVPVTPAAVQVHIFKYIDGVKATAANANSVSFPMFTSTFSAPFTLGPSGWTTGDIAYEASTSPMSVGSSYSAEENLSTDLVGASCTEGKLYALVGYSVGDTLADAVVATPSLTVPNFTNLTGDKYVIVQNHLCPAPTTLKVHILKYLDGQEATAQSGNNYLFPMTATWQTANLDGGAIATGTYVLGNNYGGAAELYGADTAAMQSPADYSTAEITDSTSQVVASPEFCAPGKYLLNGYRISNASFADAATQPLSAAAPAFIGLSSDQYVIVDNSLCPTKGSLVIEKNTIDGNGTFKFTGDMGKFQITTTGGVGLSQTFANLAPGTYHIAETAQKGWTMVSNDCSSVVVVAGAPTTCIVTNSKNPKLGEIRGIKYEDWDGDGSPFESKWEVKLSGWTIYLDTNDNGVLDNGEPSMVTGKNGAYHFSGLVAGTYHVREVLKSGWMSTYPSSNASSDKYDIILAAGQIAKNKDFGNFKLGSISGMKFNDVNGNGRKDKNEAGLAGWTITLAKPDGSTITVATDSSGKYSFGDLPAGTYKVTEVQQNGWTQTTKNPGKIKINSGTVSKNNNFGNTQKVIDDEDPCYHN